jgi:hypothetical protein
MWYSSQGRMADQITDTVLVDSGVMVNAVDVTCMSLGTPALKRN